VIRVVDFYRCFSRKRPRATTHDGKNALKTCRSPTRLCPMQSVFTGPIYVVRDNIDTDQIISAQYLNLVPTIPEEYEKLGSYALAGLPDSLYPTRFVEKGEVDAKYPIVVGGK